MYLVNFRITRGQEFRKVAFRICVSHKKPRRLQISRHAYTAPRRRIEWAVNIWVIDGDIQKAYDYTRHNQVLNSLLSHGCPDVVAAAWTREFRNLKVKLKLADLVTDPISWNRAILQGVPSAPNLFNLALDEPLTLFLNICQ